MLADCPIASNFVAGPFGAAFFFGLTLKKTDTKTKIVLDFTDAYHQFADKVEKQWTGFQPETMRFQLKMLRRWALPPSVIESAASQGSLINKTIDAELGRNKNRKHELGE